MTPRQRLIAWGVIAGLHVAVLGGLLIAKISKPPAPPETTLMVNLISEAPAAPPEATPTPPEPTPPTPLPQMVATPKPTMSAMTAPPVEEPKRDVAPQPAPAAPAAPAAAAPAAASITPPNFSAAYLKNTLPPYPMTSRRRREEGTVFLKVRVNTDGTADEVLLHKSSGFPELDNVALDFVKKRWRFIPAKQAGQPVAAWVIAPLQFEITKR